MTISHQIIESYKSLQLTLGHVLKGHSHKLSIVPAGEQQLLLLETLGDAVGFIITSDTPEETYPTAYSAFKEFYRQKHEVWKELSLSFVVFRSHNVPIHDQFFSGIETDVYFCKKYVLILAANEEGVTQELLRLPFLPFPEGREGGVTRPPSAQSLLQHHGVNATLARQLIAPGNSARTIINSLVTQPEMSFETKNISASDEQHGAPPTERTRLKKLTIEAFRAYGKSQEFDLDADIIVLYGPNGLGKTSFFDAIDYACTGRIGRLCRHRTSQESFVEFARNLGSAQDAGSVAMEVYRDSLTTTLCRSVNNWGEALIGNEKHDRTSTLQFLTSADWGPNKTRIENLERLFRATHLYSQTDQELFLDFGSNSKLSSDLVSRALALDDYASGLAKTGEVLSILDKEITACKNKSEFLEKEICEVKDRLLSLPQSQETVEIGHQLKKIADTLKFDLINNSNINIDCEEVTASSVREWRAVIESALRESQDRITLLNKLEADLGRFQHNKTNLVVKRIKLSKQDQEIKRLELERDVLQHKLGGMLPKVDAYTQDLAGMQAERRDLDKLGQLQEVGAGVAESLSKWREELKRVESGAAAAASELQKLLQIAEELNNNERELQAEVNLKVQWVQKATKVEHGLSVWEADRGEIAILKQIIQKNQSRLDELHVSITHCENNFDSKRLELDALVREHEKLTENRADLTRILDELEAHVNDSMCPACGIDHKTQVDLLERIRSQKELRPAHVEELGSRCLQLKRYLQELDDVRKSLLFEQDAIKKSSQKHGMELVAKLQSITDFNNTLSHLGLSSDDANLKDTVSQLLMDCVYKLKGSQDALEIIRSETCSLAARIKELESKRVQENEGRRLANDAIKTLEKQIKLLYSQAEAMNLSFDLNAADLEAKKGTIASKVVEIKKQMSDLESEGKCIRQAISETERIYNELNVTAISFRKETEMLEAELARFEGAFGNIGPEIRSLDLVSEQRKQAVERLEGLESAMLRALTLERALDSVQRSAMVAELEARTRALTLQKQQVEKQTYALSAAKKWCTKVNGRLEEQNTNAVSNHVSAFGPLTTFIQKRLRAVYGFGDISLRPKGSEISVIVNWENKSIKPMDYFSDSQKQILMLSLFLAGRLTQTWSGFAPIILDDPVTHFDDLNAFGFVELIRGLVSTSPGKRQFFISTCEERLFQLMRKKFGNTERGAKFYRFESASPDGPIITKL